MPARTRRWTVGVAALLAASLATTLPAGAVTAKVWHILPADLVESARLAPDAFTAVDASITSVEYRKGGVGNIDVCGFQRTEHISASRQARWSASDRSGATLILQFRDVVDGGAAFSRLKQAYLSCTPDTFGYQYPSRVDLSAKYLKKRKQLRLVWAIYTSNAKTEVLRAEGLAIRRAGGALIITRSITKDLAAVKPAVNQKLTARQYAKYRNAAYF